jgi:hypothetical protein
MVFGIGFSIASFDEQPNNLEALRRAAAYQDCHRHTVRKMASHSFGRCDGHHKMVDFIGFGALANPAEVSFGCWVRQPSPSLNFEQ